MFADTDRIAGLVDNRDVGQGPSPGWIDFPHFVVQLQPVADVDGLDEADAVVAERLQDQRRLR